MKRKRIFSLVLMMGVVFFGGLALGASNSCVDCHRKPETIMGLPAWYQDAFVHWYGSIHGRKNVTCDRCHGGDSSQPDKKKAHKGVRSNSDPKSPIYYKNVPETCKPCHEGVFEQFTQSLHYRNLKADRLAPTCTTCHGFQMDIQEVVPLQLVERCVICHNKMQGVKPEIAELAHQTLSEIGKTQHAIHRAEMAIDIGKEEGFELRDSEVQLQRARDRLSKTGEIWHRFDLTGFKKELTEIQTMVDEVRNNVRKAIIKTE